MRRHGEAKANLVLCDGRILSFLKVPFQSFDRTRLSTSVRESSVLVKGRLIVIVGGLRGFVTLSKRFNEVRHDILGVGRLVELLTVASVRAGFELGERLELLRGRETVATEYGKSFDAFAEWGKDVRRFGDRER